MRLIDYINDNFGAFNNYFSRDYPEICNLWVSTNYNKIIRNELIYNSTLYINFNKIIEHWLKIYSIELDKIDQLIKNRWNKNLLGETTIAISEDENSFSNIDFNGGEGLSSKQKNNNNNNINHYNQKNLTHQFLINFMDYECFRVLDKLLFVGVLYV